MKLNEREYMKRTIVSLACALIAPVAFAQTSTTTEQTTTTQPTTTTETTTATTTASGTVTTYESGKTMVVKTESGNPVSYVLGKTVHYVNKAGKTVKHALIRPGTKVQVVYTQSGDQMVADRVIVEE
jgi:Cu/Zn superoxide dismutase